MRNSRMKKIAAASSVMLLLLSGCGEAPYELTESEESIIVNYASDVVAKFNIKQKDGLSYVDLSQLEEETETEEPDTQETEETEGNSENSGKTEKGQTDSGDAVAGTENDETQSTEKTLQETFGTENLTVQYAGYELASNYMEGDYYNMDADTGKQYLIVSIDLTNTGTEDTAVDMLAQALSVSVTADGISSDAEQTFLANDFSTYQDTVATGKTVRTVLLFQVSDMVESVSELSLNVTLNGENITIIL